MSIITTRGRPPPIHVIRFTVESTDERRQCGEEMIAITKLLLYPTTAYNGALGVGIPKQSAR